MIVQQAPEQRYLLYPSAQIAQKIGVEGYRWACNATDCINMRESLSPELATQGSLDAAIAEAIQSAVASAIPQAFFYRPETEGITFVDIVDEGGAEVVYYPKSTLVIVEGYSEYSSRYTEVVNPYTGNYSRIQFSKPLPYDPNLSPSGAPVIIYHVPKIST